MRIPYFMALVCLASSPALAGEAPRFDLQLGREVKRISPASRACCSLGIRVPTFVGIPVTQVADFPDLGEHEFANRGVGREINGEVYSCRGGFVDLGHLRHVADWTAHLVSTIARELSDKSSVTLDLGREGADLKLTVRNPPEGEWDAESLIRLGMRAAYDLSVWHEINTWFGHSNFILFSEKASSFSGEDNYSNILGAYVGRDALRAVLERGIPYTVAINEILPKTLWDLGALGDGPTLAALRQVQGVWWTRKRASADTEKTRHLGAYGTVVPWQVPDGAAVGCRAGDTPLSLEVPEKDTWGRPLDRFFDLHLTRLTWRLHLARESRLGYVPAQFSQRDFPALIELVKREAGDH